MKFLKYLLPATLSLLIATNVGSQDLNLILKEKQKVKFHHLKMLKYMHIRSNLQIALIHLSKIILKIINI